MWTTCRSRARFEANVVTMTRPGRLADQLFEVLADHRLGAGPAPILDPHAVREEGQHSLVAEAPQGLLVGAAPVDRLPVELVVARVEDRAGGRLDGEADRAGHAVVDVDGLDRERIEVDDVAGLELDQLDAIELRCSRSLVVDQAERHLGAVDRDRVGARPSA